MMNKMILPLLMILSAGLIACEGEPLNLIDPALANQSVTVKSGIIQLGTRTAPGSASGNDICNGIALDSSGNYYCGGTTSGNLKELNGGSTDVFVMKVSAAGNVVWITQLGTVTAPTVSTGTDTCNAIALDSSGNLYCGGRTTGNLGETSGGNADAFIAKFDSSGALAWIKQLGGTSAPGSAAQNDSCLGITVDNLGGVYCSGETESDLDGNGNAGGSDAFVMKLATSNGAVQWVKQLGASEGTYDASQTDVCAAISYFGGFVSCAGATQGDLAELAGGTATTPSDSIVMNLNATTGAIQWVRQFGQATMGAPASFGRDYCISVVTGSDGSVYCAGTTEGPLGEANAGGFDAFVTKLNPSGVVQWVKQFGAVNAPMSGALDDLCYGLTIDSSDNVICGGETKSNLIETNAGNIDIFAIKLDSSGIIRSTYQLGQATGTGDKTGEDSCRSIAVDSTGVMYCAGFTTGNLEETNGGGRDALLMKIKQ